VNPDTAIKPWLLAVSKQWGIRQAHEYRWPDADKRQEEMYYTYRIIGSHKDTNAVSDFTTASGNDASVSGAQQWITKVQIDLYRSQGGIDELAACIVAAQHNGTIRRLFAAHGASYFESEDVKDLTTFDDERIDYHQQVMVNFYEHMQYDLTDSNGVVDEIHWNLESGSPTWVITKNGITPP
jgi:hypothetical protein